MVRPVKALRRLTVRAAFPAELTGLSQIVSNLRWSWHPDSMDLLESVDPQLWESTGGDPIKMLGEVSAERLAVLAADRKFRRRLSDVVDDLQEYLTAPRWYQKEQAAAASGAMPEAIGYFSPEFGIHEVLPQYSGGLGILAGDHLKAASDLGVPIIGVGLLYRAGYFTQSLSREGWQLERYPSLDPQGLPIKALTDASGAPVKIAIDLPDGRVLHSLVWKVQVGRVPLLLMDSDVEENDAAARGVTDRLYGGGKEHRLLQEMLLGIGGVRAIRAFCALGAGFPTPQVFHTNEGHAGFLGLERIRELTEAPDGQALSFDDALQAVRAGTVFTTHTPVPAGIDRFERRMIQEYFGGSSASPGVPVERILELGAEEDPSMFNMAHMGLRLGQRANGVSMLHGDVSRGMFSSLWPGFDSGDVPISSITNGVHAPTWMSREMAELAERVAGPAALDDGSGWAGLEKISDSEIWGIRGDLRAKLVGEIRTRLRASSLQRGMSGAQLGWINTAFDPDVLTLGFARRVPSYKRLTLMLSDPERLRALLLDPERPVQIVIAGKSHPADDGGKELIQKMVQFADQADVRHRIAFLPDYDIGMARYLYWGSDVWMNNPLRPLEACGTSGMKSALNGGLNLSVLDGWWDEWFDGENGWAIPSIEGDIDPIARDVIEANGLYDLIEHQVSTRFYERDKGIPTQWVAMVRHTLATLGPKVLATRMVRDYVTKLYAPAGAAATVMAADNHAAAAELATWRNRVVGSWPGVKVRYVDSSVEGDPQLGGTLRLRAEVALGGLELEDLDVSAVFGAVDVEDRLINTETQALTPGAVEDGAAFYEGDIPLDHTGSFGYTVRVMPKHRLLASESELGVIAIA
jgi:starch phosphorylase